MKTIILKLITASFLMSLVACVETTAPLCNAGNAADIPGIKSDYQVSILMQADASLESHKMKITRQGRGKYQIQNPDGGADMNTCRVGRYLVAETASEAGTYKQQIVNVGQNQTLTLSQWVFDVHELALNGIKYSVMDRAVSPTVNAWSASLGIKPVQTEKVLIIENNTAAENNALGKLARPNAFGITLN